MHFRGAANHLPDRGGLTADPTLLGEDDEGRSAHTAGWEDVQEDLLATDLELMFKGCERHPLP
jgi:hypothetical protein